MKKILILGINGFVGHHLAARILSTTRWEVYGMDISTNRITGLLKHPLTDSGLEKFLADHKKTNG